MKTKTLKRALAALTAVAMLVGLTACAGGSDNSDSTSSGIESTSSGTESTASAEEDGPLTPYEEPVKLTWAVQASAVQQFKDGDTYDDNVWSRLIKEKLNIDLEVAFSADISTDAYKNKMNVMLASGEFPDVVRYDNRTFFKQAQEAGYIQPIGDVFEQYATDAVKAYETEYADAFEGAKIDNQLYAFPYMNDNFHQAAFLWIRDDWLENTNSEPPKTVDEMVELARKFTFEDPDGNGQDDTYGFGLAGSVVQSNYGTLLGLAGAYGVPGYGNTGVFYRDDDGKMTFAYLQPGMKDCLALVHQMYEEGLIDPEFVSEDVASMEEEVTNGTLGMMYHMNWGTWHPFNYSYQQDGVITRPYPIPTVDGIEPKMGINSNQTGDLFMVSAECEHPEAIIKILNLYEQVAISSEDPNDFQTYWANEQYRLCPIYIGMPTENFAPVIHEALEAGTSDGLAGTALEYYNYVVDFEDGSLKDDTNAYGTWGQMYIDGYGGSMKIALDYQSKGWLVTNVMANEMPDIWLQNSSVLGDMVDTTFVDIITGNKPVDYFDTFVEEWLAAGGQATLDALDEMYPAE
ncbi:extracellular solute-binding protein [Hominenteromicrobium sp.]|uniref:extracellular solute-binding protein n=1 Tax=Hominenteromicrobium sp. TaxID=3073581 RepID=UPI003A959AD1